MLKYINENFYISQLLSQAKTNFIPLENYNFSESPSIIPSVPHMRIWRGYPRWEECKKIFEPSKICFISDIGKTPKNIYDQIIFNDCSLIDDGTHDGKRYILIRPVRKFSCPMWDMKSDGIVLLHNGGGYGDFFSSLRYIKMYKNIKFIVDVQDSLYRLAKSTGIFYDVVKKGDECRSDFHIPVKKIWEKHLHRGSSLPIIKVPTHPDVSGGIGFCFMGNRVKYTTRRTFDYRIMEKFKDFKLYNLQLEKKVDFAINLPIYDWYDTASIIQGCDLIVSCPTSITHLAGIMGKPQIVVFRQEFESFETLFFDESGSKYYPLKKVYEKNLELSIRNHVVLGNKK